MLSQGLNNEQADEYITFLNAFKYIFICWIFVLVILFVLAHYHISFCWSVDGLAVKQNHQWKDP